jgi:hypothetical protein
VLASFGGADMEASFRQAPTRSVIGIGEWIGWIKIQEIFSVKQEIFRFFFGKMERKTTPPVAWSVLIFGSPGT